MADPFDEHMDQWQDHSEREKRKSEEASDRRTDFLDAFESWAMDVAQPVLERYADRLRGRGLHAQVMLDQSDPGEPGGMRDLKIAVRLEVGPSEGDTTTMSMRPHVDGEAVGIGIQSRRRPLKDMRERSRYPIAEVNEEVVDELVMEFLRDVFPTE